MPSDTAYDVVVLGSGIAGLAGALAAHEKGLSAVVLEKAEKVGGGTTNSYGLIWVGNNHLARAAGLKESRAEVIDYMRFLGAGSQNEARMIAAVDRAPEALKFFEDCGIRFRVVRGLTDHYYGRAPGGQAAGRSVEVELISGDDLGDWRDRVVMPHDVPCFVTAEEQVAWGGLNRFSQWDKDIVAERKRRDMRGKGLGLICHFLKAVTERGVPVLTGQEVDRLAVENDRVTGVVLSSGERVLARKGVILATGGYHANAALSQEYDQLPGIGQDPSTLSLPSITGDGIVLGAEIGGVTHKIENSLRVMLSYTIPAARKGDTPICVHAGIVELCSPHTMVVNRRGRRFADETFFQGIVPEIRRFDALRHEYPNLPAYLIFDSQYVARYSFANAPAGSPVPASVPTAGSLRELADKLGIDGTELEKTVARFNGFVAKGVDPDFHRGENQWKLASAKAPRGGNASLGIIEEPPFYGIELHPTSAGTVGLLTDANGQVVHQRRRPIAGLYASGNVASATEFGIGYQAGLSLAGSMTFSYLAVGHMLNGASRQ
jgi:3-oxosteroid 1-dehydrogenase